MFEFFSKSKEAFKKKISSFIKYGLEKFGHTVIEDEIEGIGVKTPDGKKFIPRAVRDTIDHPQKIIDWFNRNMPDPQEYIYEEPPDEVVKGYKPSSQFEKLPEYYEGEVLPQEQKGNISAIKAWIEIVKWADMSDEDLRAEYNKHKGTTDRHYIELNFELCLKTLWKSWGAHNRP